MSCVKCWSPFRYPIRLLVVRSRKVSKSRDLYLELYDWFEIRQAPWQQCCRCACQITKRCEDLNYKSRVFETSRDLTIRCLVGYWSRALVFLSRPHCEILTRHLTLFIQVDVGFHGSHLVPQYVDQQHGHHSYDDANRPGAPTPSMGIR